MVEIADKDGKTAIVNILHIFKNIKENMNMIRIEMVLGGKYIALSTYIRKIERPQTN